MTILAEARPFEMAFERKVVELKVRGSEPVFNEHLAKLLAFDAPAELRASWKRELLRKYLTYFASLRFKPERRFVPRRAWWAWLYDDPFGGNEEGVALHLIIQHEDAYPRNGRTTAEVADAIRAFHAALSERLARGDTGADLLEPL